MVTVRNPWKLCTWVLTSLLVLYLVLLAAVQISQRIIRRRAEHLLSDLRGLQLEKSSWSDAQALMQRWGKWGGYRGICNVKHCEYLIQFNSLEMVPKLTKILEPLPDFFIRPVEMATSALHANLPYVYGGFHVENNLVIGTWFTVGSERPIGFGRIMGGVHGVRTRDLEPYKLWPEKDPHPEFRTVLRSGTIGIFFTEFTAATKPEDVEWLAAVDFSCITRWVPCEERGDLLPSAWAKYSAERKQVSATWERIAYCAYPLEDLVAASERVALVRVEKSNSQERQWSPYPARLVESLKGSGSWHSGDIRKIWSGEDPVASTEILLFTDDSDPVRPYNCGVIPATPENLRTVKAAVGRAH